MKNQILENILKKKKKKEDLKNWKNIQKRLTIYWNL